MFDYGFQIQKVWGIPFLLLNWQIMPFGHITPVPMVVCRLMVYQNFFDSIVKKLLHYRAGGLLQYRAFLLHYRALITLSGVFITLSGTVLRCILPISIRKDKIR